MAKLFLFRHGETTDNQKKIFSGWRDVDLTQEGIEEAKRLSEKLKNEKTTKAYSSDLIRSQHTLALVLGEYHKNVPVHIDPRIKERDYGKLTGTSKTELEKKSPKDFEKWHRSYDIAPPGGESIKDVEKRVMPFIHELLKTTKPSDVIFISAHGNSIRPFIHYFEKISWEEVMKKEYGPGSLFTYDL